MKTVLVTGGGRGLGRVTAEKLAVAGNRVILVARTPEAAEAAAGEIRRNHPGALVEPRSVDLSSLSEVRAFASLEAERGEVIDVLFHVAGVMQQSATRRVTVDGYEETLAVNVLAPFLLTHLLLPGARAVPCRPRCHRQLASPPARFTRGTGPLRLRRPAAGTRLSPGPGIQELQAGRAVVHLRAAAPAPTSADHRQCGLPGLRACHGGREHARCDALRDAARDAPYAVRDIRG